MPIPISTYLYPPTVIFIKDKLKLLHFSTSFLAHVCLQALFQPNYFLQPFLQDKTVLDELNDC